MPGPYEIRYTQEALADLKALRKFEQAKVLEVALLTPFDDEDLEWYKRERDPEFLASLAEARKQVAEGKTVSHAEVKKLLGID